METNALMPSLIEVFNMGALALLSFLIGLVMIFRNDMLKRMDQGAERTQAISNKQSEISAHLARLNSKTDTTIERLHRFEDRYQSEKGEMWARINSQIGGV